MTRWSDEQIIAYLDGKLDMEQGQALHRDRQFDDELDAYIASLEIDTNELANLSQEMPLDTPQFDFETTSAAKTSAKTPLWKQTAIAASVLAVFGAGFLTSSLLPSNNPPPANWVQAVAEYQMLYSGETLKLLQKSDDQTAQEVAVIGRKLDIILTRSDLNLNGLKLRRSQFLTFKNKPLVQFAYLDDNGVPISFCIIKRENKPDQPMKARAMVAGQNAAVWSAGEFGFVVIGKAKPSVIRQYAEELKAKMTSL